LPIVTTYMVGGVTSPDLPPCVPPSLSNGTCWYGTLNPLSITYAFRPRLRPDSPAVDQHGCGTLGHPVGGIRTPLALLMPTFALPPAPGQFPLPLLGWTGRSPTTRRISDASAASAADLSPGGLSAPRHHRPVSYYALFQGWLLLSQPPGCLCTGTTLPTESALGDLSRRSGLFPSRRRNLAPAVSLQHSSATAFDVWFGSVSGKPPRRSSHATSAVVSLVLGCT
jgi:hypothetical protein